MLYFDCDYMEGAHPAILQRLMETNMEHTYGYGKDAYCESAKDPHSMPVPGGGNLFSGGRNPDKCDRDPGIFKALRGGYCSGYRAYRCPRGRCN